MRLNSVLTLGSELERDRLELRVRRATVALAALHQRASEHGRAERPARHLRQAIVDFEAQVEAMNARLRDLAPERSSNRAQRVERTG
jgi:hypothetical protein